MAIIPYEDDGDVWDLDLVDDQITGAVMGVTNLPGNYYGPTGANGPTGVTGYSPPELTPEEIEAARELERKRRLAQIEANKKAEKETEKKRAQLVRPGDITDAVDATDLEQILLAANVQRIEEKATEAHRRELLSDATREIHSHYRERAKDFYERLWGACERTPRGHTWTNMDARGHTIQGCQACGYADESSSMNHGVAHEMNEELIRALSDQMKELDDDAGLIRWPEAEDFDQVVVRVPTRTPVGQSVGKLKPVKKVRKMFGGKS